MHPHLKEQCCLIVLPSFRAGGAENIAIRIANDLANRGFNVRLAAIDGAGEFRGRIVANVTIIDLRIRRTRYAAFALLRLIWRTKPSVIFSTLTRVNLLILLARPMLPRAMRIVVRQPSMPSRELASLQPRWLYRLLFHRCIGMADVVISQSETMTKDLIKCIGQAPHGLVTIGNPAPDVDLNWYRQQPSPYSGGVNYVAVGRLSEEKNYALLLRAFAEVKKQRPNSCLTLVGDGALAGLLRELADKLGVGDCVRLAGFAPDPFVFYVHADVLVLTSKWEGFPNVLLEAIAVGTPVVATPCGGVAAEIVVNGENGIVVVADDEKEGAEAMISVLDISLRRSRFDIAKSIARFDGLQTMAKLRNAIYGPKDFG